MFHRCWNWPAPKDEAGPGVSSNERRRAHVVARPWRAGAFAGWSLFGEALALAGLPLAGQGFARWRASVNDEHFPWCREQSLSRAGSRLGEPRARLDVDVDGGAQRRRRWELRRLDRPHQPRPPVRRRRRRQREGTLLRRNPLQDAPPPLVGCAAAQVIFRPRTRGTPACGRGVPPAAAHQPSAHDR